MTLPIIVTDHAWERYRTRINAGITREQIAEQVAAAGPCPRRLIKCVGIGDQSPAHGGEYEILLHEPTAAIFVTARHPDRVVVITTVALGMAESIYRQHGRKWHKRKAKR